MRLNLQTRLLVFLVLPVAVINLSTFFWGFLYSRESLIDQWIRGADAKLNYAASQIGRGIEEKLTLIRAIRQAEDGPQGPAVQAFITQLLLTTKCVRFVDIRRTDYSSDEAQSSVCPHRHGTPLHDGPHPYHGVEPPHNVSGVEFRVHPNFDFLDIVSAFPGNDDRSCVETHVTVRFGCLIDEVTKLRLWQGAKALLVNEEGVCMAASDPALVNRRLSDLKDPLVDKILLEMKRRDSGTLFGQGRPPKLVMGFRRVPSTDWRLMIYVEGCEICRPMIHFRWVFLSANLASLVLIVVLVMLVTRPIVSGIKEISQTAEQVEQGNYSVQLLETGSDELGRLKRRFNKMIEGLRQRDLIQSMFGRYVGGPVARELLKGAANLDLGGQEKTVTILMADLRGFTPICERLRPTEVIRVLNRYLSRMTAVIEDEKGVIVDFYGDGILAFFDGADDEIAERAMDALRAAETMQRCLKTVSEENLREQLPKLGMGIGIHTGQAVVGNIGSERRAKYGVVGASVNTVHRIQASAAAGAILISGTVLELLGNRVKTLRTIQGKLKGIQGTLELYEVAQVKNTQPSPTPIR